MAETSSKSTSAGTTTESRGGIGCCGCCAAALVVILIVTAAIAIQFLTWARNLWTSLDSEQRTGVLVILALATLAALVVMWRARPQVTARTRLVTTRVTRRPTESHTSRTTDGTELPGEWRPATRPSGVDEYAEVPGAHDAGTPVAPRDAGSSEKI